MAVLRRRPFRAIGGHRFGRRPRWPAMRRRLGRQRPPPRRARTKAVTVRHDTKAPLCALQCALRDAGRGAGPVHFHGAHRARRQQLAKEALCLGLLTAVVGGTAAGPQRVGQRDRHGFAVPRHHAATVSVHDREPVGGVLHTHVALVVEEDAPDAGGVSRIGGHVEDGAGDSTEGDAGADALGDGLLTGLVQVGDADHRHAVPHAVPLGDPCEGQQGGAHLGVLEAVHFAEVSRDGSISRSAGRMVLTACSSASARSGRCRVGRAR